MGGDSGATGSSLGGGYASAPSLQSTQQRDIWGNAISSIGQAGYSSTPMAQANYSQFSVPNMVIPNAPAPAPLIPVTQQQPDLLEILQRILQTSGGGY